MAFIDEQPVDAQLLKGHGVVLGALIVELLFVGSIKGIHAEAIAGAVIAAAQYLVHLIGGNKKLPVGSKPVGNGKMKRLPL